MSGSMGPPAPKPQHDTSSALLNESFQANQSNSQYRMQFDAYRRKVIEQQNELRASQIRRNIIHERATLLEGSLNSALDSLKHHKTVRVQLERTVDDLKRELLQRDELLERMKQAETNFNSQLEILQTNEQNRRYDEERVSAQKDSLIAELRRELEEQANAPAPQTVVNNTPELLNHVKELEERLAVLSRVEGKYESTEREKQRLEEKLQAADDKNRALTIQNAVLETKLASQAEQGDTSKVSLEMQSHMSDISFQCANTVERCGEVYTLLSQTADNQERAVSAMAAELQKLPPFLASLLGTEGALSQNLTKQLQEKSNHGPSLNVDVMTQIVRSEIADADYRRELQEALSDLMDKMREACLGVDQTRRLIALGGSGGNQSKANTPQKKLDIKSLSPLLADMTEGLKQSLRDVDKRQGQKLRELQTYIVAEVKANNSDENVNRVLSSLLLKTGNRLEAHVTSEGKRTRALISESVVAPPPVLDETKGLNLTSEGGRGLSDILTSLNAKIESMNAEQEQQRGLLGEFHESAKQLKSMMGDLSMRQGHSGILSQSHSFAFSPGFKSKQQRPPSSLDDPRDNDSHMSQMSEVSLGGFGSFNEDSKIDEKHFLDGIRELKTQHVKCAKDTELVKKEWTVFEQLQIDKLGEAITRLEGSDMHAVMKKIKGSFSLVSDSKTSNVSILRICKESLAMLEKAEGQIELIEKIRTLAELDKKVLRFKNNILQVMTKMDSLVELLESCDKKDATSPTFIRQRNAMIADLTAEMDTCDTQQNKFLLFLQQARRELKSATFPLISEKFMYISKTLLAWGSELSKPQYQQGNKEQLVSWAGEVNSPAFSNTMESLCTASTDIQAQLLDIVSLDFDGVMPKFTRPLYRLVEEFQELQHRLHTLVTYLDECSENPY